MSTVLFDCIKAQSKIDDAVLVAFSGGKDSIVTLDLCFRYFKRVIPFFMYLVPGISFQEKLLRWYEEKYNTDIIRLPHFETSDFFRYGTFRNFDFDVPIVSITDVYNYLRGETGNTWIAAGERINDSIVRRAMIKHTGSIDKKRGRFYPVAYWKKSEILQYIRFHKLKMGEDSKKLGFSFRSLSGKELAMVRKYYPADFEKILKIYPFAGASAERWERYGDNKVSEI